MAKNIIINQSVAILCDGNNIERSLQEQSPSAMINFDTLIPKLLNERGLNRFIYFREGKNISSKLAERLYNRYYGSVVPCHKSADIPLSIKATQLASKVDTIIIMSGDSDYVELVHHLKSEGVRVEIAAVEKTTAKILRVEADYFHPITKSDIFIFNSPRPERRRPIVGKVPVVSEQKPVAPIIKPALAVVESKPAQMPPIPGGANIPEKKTEPVAEKKPIVKKTAPAKKESAPVKEPEKKPKKKSIASTLKKLVSGKKK